jgi:hypothetical protein
MFREAPMILLRLVRILVCCSAVGVVVLAAGCGSKPVPRDQTPGEANIARFYTMYAGCRASLKGKSPSSVEEVRDWAKKQTKEKLTQLGVVDVDTACISPRDNQPYVVVELPMGMGPVVAHEKDGVSGRRLVVNSQGSVIDANESQFQSLLRTVSRMPAAPVKTAKMGPPRGGPSAKPSGAGGPAKPSGPGEPAKSPGSGEPGKASP